VFPRRRFRAFGVQTMRLTVATRWSWGGELSDFLSPVGATVVSRSFRGGAPWFSPSCGAVPA